MNKLKEKTLQIGILGLFALSVTITGFQLARTANAKQTRDGLPFCHGLSCVTGSDCGSKCFCNGPSSKCIADQ